MKHYGYQVGYESHRVDGRFEVLLADNGEQADARICLKAAPSITEPGLAICYITTSGDPMQVCTLDRDGVVDWYLGENEPEGTENITIAMALDGFAQFAGMEPEECANWCEVLFGKHCER